MQQIFLLETAPLQTVPFNAGGQPRGQARHEGCARAACAAAGPGKLRARCSSVQHALHLCLAAHNVQPCAILTCTELTACPYPPPPHCSSAGRTGSGRRGGASWPPSRPHSRCFELLSDGGRGRGRGGLDWCRHRPGCLLPLHTCSRACNSSNTFTELCNIPCKPRAALVKEHQ